MGRCKSFEEQEALKKALEYFWKNGYEAAPTRDLAKAMGISYGSFYNTFKDKRTLYVESLDLYICTFVSKLIQTIDNATSAKATLREILCQVVDESVKSTVDCFVGSAILGLANHDEEIAQKVAHMNTSIEMAIERLLTRAYEAGEINPQNSLASVAHFMVNTMSGIRLAARLDDNKDKLKGIVEVALSIL